MGPPRPVRSLPRCTGGRGSPGVVGLPLDARSRYEEGRLVGIDYTHPAIAALPEDQLPSRSPATGRRRRLRCATSALRRGPPGSTRRARSPWPRSSGSFLAVTPASPLTVPKGPGAACQRCHDAIEAGDWNSVTYCALCRYRASLRPIMEPGCVPCGARSSNTEPTHRRPGRPAGSDTRSSTVPAHLQGQPWGADRTIDALHKRLQDRLP